jgi:hypothetical protein
MAGKRPHLATKVENIDQLKTILRLNSFHTSQSLPVHTTSEAYPIPSCATTCRKIHHCNTHLPGAGNNTAYQKTVKNCYTKLWRHASPCQRTPTHSPTTHSLKGPPRQPVSTKPLSSISPLVAHCLVASLPFPPTSRQKVRHKALVQTFNDTSRTSFRR